MVEKRSQATQSYGGQEFTLHLTFCQKGSAQGIEINIVRYSCLTHKIATPFVNFFHSNLSSKEDCYNDDLVLTWEKNQRVGRYEEIGFILWQSTDGASARLLKSLLHTYQCCRDFDRYGKQFHPHCTSCQQAATMSWDIWCRKIRFIDLDLSWHIMKQNHNIVQRASTLIVLQ